MRASLSEFEIEEQNESGDVKLQLDSAFLKLKRIFLDRIEHDQKGFKKALTTFDKHLDRMPKSNDAVLQKALCTFGQDSIAPLKLAKRKNSRLIPVQVKRGLSIHWFAYRGKLSFFGRKLSLLEGLRMYSFCAFDTACMYAVSNPQKSMHGSSTRTCNHPFGNARI